MATPEGAANAELVTKYQITLQQINDKMFDWEELSNKLN